MATEYRSIDQQQADSFHARAWRAELLELHGEQIIQPYVPAIGSDGPNLRLSSVCEQGEHGTCTSIAYAYTAGAPIPRCRCLCHQATRADYLEWLANGPAPDASRLAVTEAGMQQLAELWARFSAEHTLATGHESWSHPRIGWTCADPSCRRYSRQITLEIERADPPDVRSPRNS
jgi:hypothetical protein